MVALTAKGCFPAGTGFQSGSALDSQYVMHFTYTHVICSSDQNQAQFTSFVPL